MLNIFFYDFVISKDISRGLVQPLVKAGIASGCWATYQVELSVSPRLEIPQLPCNQSIQIRCDKRKL